MAKKLTIVHLYPQEMNIYGDTGNVLVLAKRLKRRNIDYEVVPVGVGDTIPSNADLIVSGGGQDAGQLRVQEDLLKKKETLVSMAKDGVVMLVICGTYQLFGHRFVTHDGAEIEGIGIFDMQTIAQEKRLIGNITIDTQFGQIVGYENHSGLTTLGANQQPFGSVLSGEGNNLSDETEGAIANHVYGTYLHGPILPKNPQFADQLLLQALQRSAPKVQLAKLDDSLALRAAQTAKSRPR